MFAIFELIRNWLEQALGQELQSLREGFLSCGSDQKQGPVLEKRILEVKPRRFLGVLPVFGFRRVGSISFSDAIKAPLEATRRTLECELEQVPHVVCKSTKEGLVAASERPNFQVKVRVSAEVERQMQKFDEQYLAGLIKTDRNGFRQKLLEELGKQAAQVFAASAKKHLAELVLRVRQEASPDGPADAVAEEVGSSLALPTGTRFVVRKGKMTTFVIEQPPQKRTIRIMYERGDRSELFQLALPYVVFFVVLRGRKSDKAYVLFRKAPLRSLKDELLCPALPNIHGDFSVCFAPSASKESLAEMAEESIASFWGGRFIKTELVSEAHRRLSVDAWADGSRKDSLFGLSYPWIPAKQTVASMLKTISAEFAADTAAQKKERSGHAVMSALETAVVQLATKVETEMKETCFRLVPSWSVDSMVLAQAGSQFRRSAAELFGFVKTELGTQVDIALSDEALKEALETAVRQTIASVGAETEQSVMRASEAFMKALKNEEAK